MALGRSKRATPPEWWRGTTPQRLRDFVGTPISGSVRNFEPAGLPVTEGTLLRSVCFQEAAAADIEVDLDDLTLTVRWSQFERCTFRQRSARLNPKGVAPQGSFGNRPSLYQHCAFVGVRFKSLGGFNTGAARFVGCQFDRCHFNGHFSRTTDYLDCTFTGKIDGCVWFGTAPQAGDDAARRNLITGNDFTNAVLGTNIGWRGDFDFAAQRWPTGYTPTVEPA